MHLVQAVLGAVERETGRVGTLAEVDLLDREDQYRRVENSHAGQFCTAFHNQPGLYNVEQCKHNTNNIIM